MTDIKIAHGTFFEGQDVTITARVTDDAGNPLVPGDVASYEVAIYDLTNDPRAESPVYEFTSSTSSEVLFATLQKDGRWSSDTTGYNFRYIFKHVDMAPFKFRGSTTYRAEIWLQSEASPSSSENTGAIPVMVDLRIQPSLKKG